MEWDVYLRFVLALIFVIGLIGGLALAVRRFGLTRRLVGAPPVGQRRLQLMESLSLDPRRRLLLVRCDDAEHLLLVGGTTDVVVGPGPAASGVAAEPEFSGSDVAASTPREVVR